MAQDWVPSRLKASASCQNGGGPRCESFLRVRGDRCLRRRERPDVSEILVWARKPSTSKPCRTSARRQLLGGKQFRLFGGRMFIFIDWVPSGA